MRWTMLTFDKWQVATFTERRPLCPYLRVIALSMALPRSPSSCLTATTAEEYYWPLTTNSDDDIRVCSNKHSLPKLSSSIKPSRNPNGQFFCSKVLKTIFSTASTLGHVKIDQRMLRRLKRALKEHDRFDSLNYCEHHKHYSHLPVLILLSWFSVKISILLQYPYLLSARLIFKCQLLICEHYFTIT